MCLVAIALDQSRRFPLVVAANRDEYFDRPANRLAWWEPGKGAPPVLGGRDLKSGGTWMGLTSEGRFALVTNVRNSGQQDPSAPSRGQVPMLWLSAKLSTDRFWTQTALSGHNGFNLIAADFRAGDCFYATNLGQLPHRLERGIFGLSNAGLDTPWPKVDQLKHNVLLALNKHAAVEGLANELFDALADRNLVADEDLPNTGVPQELERQLSAAFIRTADGRYGTRSSTLVITERVNKRLVTHVLERTFSATSSSALLRRAVLRGWPPKYEVGSDGRMSTVANAVVAEDVSESEVSSAVPPELPPTAKRTRVRSLIKPIGA
jgi:uncharacterized protein with NRDE domain